MVSPMHIRTSYGADANERLVEHVDLYYLHRVDPTVPIEDSSFTAARVTRTPG